MSDFSPLAWPDGFVPTPDNWHTAFRDAAFSYVRSFGVMADGVTDDTGALNQMFAAWASSLINVPLVLPSGDYLLLGQLNIVVPDDRALVLTSLGPHGARFRVAGNPAVALSVTSSQSSGAAHGPSVSISNITFTKTLGYGSTALQVVCAEGGEVSPTPGCVIENVHFENEPGAGWTGGLSLFGTNLARVQRMSAMGMPVGSVALRIDTDSRICVDLDVDDLYVNGAGDGVVIGQPGEASPLQGITLRRPSFTNCARGVVWEAASNADQLTITDGQINCTGPGLYIRGLTTLIVKGNYFLGCSKALDLQNVTRIAVTGNVFDGIGGNGGAASYNTCMKLVDCAGGPDAGNVISGNVMTNYVTVNQPNGCVINLSGVTTYTVISGNIALGVGLVYDSTPVAYAAANCIGPNFDGSGWRFQTQIGPLAVNGALTVNGPLNQGAVQFISGVGAPASALPAGFVAALYLDGATGHIWTRITGGAWTDKG